MKHVARTPPSPTVCVFAPAPLLTVTMESAGTGTSTEIHVHAGGQGYWIARMLACLGIDVVLCGSFGGELGQIARWVIEQQGIRVAGVSARADNGGYVHDRRAGTRTELARSISHTLDRHDVDSLYGATLVEGLAAAVTVLTGPAEDDILPSDVYRRLAIDIGTNGGCVVADLSGSRLRAALEGGVHLAKVSLEELVRDGDQPPGRRIPQVLDDVRSWGAEHVVVSCAEDGAFALLDSRRYRLTTPEFVPFDTRGAGDSMTAATAGAIARGVGLLDAVKRGMAAGALNVTRRGLGSGVGDQISLVVNMVDALDLDEATDTAHALH